MYKNKNQIFIVILSSLFVLGAWFFNYEKVEAAQYQYVPTSQNLVTGTDKTATSATVAAATGVNMGSWRGTLADDNLHWSVLGLNPGGFDVQLNMDNVNLNGANRMVFQTEIDTDAALAVKFQICDWVSSTSVDAAADAQCTGGGWRSLNTQSASNTDVNYTENNTDAMQWHVYDGYWSTGTTGGTAVSTPLSNFVKADSTKRVKFRFVSATASATDIDIDFLRMMVMVDSIYHPSGLTNLGTGAMAGTYANAQAIGNSATGQQATTTGDAVYVTIAGTAGSVSDSYFSFTDVRTLPSMNSILVRADFSCSVATGNLSPQIRNFNSSTWENLSAATIACNATNATNGWTKNNITLSNYISSGEVRVRWVGSANGTHTIRLDSIYIMVGSTNADSGLCEVTIGSGTASNCTNTRTLDMNSATSSFDNTAEDLSTNMGTGTAAAQYALDAPQSAAGALEATASNITVPMAIDTDTQVVGINFAARYAAGTPGATPLVVQPGIFNYTGMSQVTGGWTQVGSTSNSATQVYSDSIANLVINSYGIVAAPNTYLDTVNQRMNMRLRTTTNGTNTANSVTAWDFAMMSLQWIEVTDTPTTDYMFTPTSQTLVTGTEQAVDASTAAATNVGLNMGSWKGAISDDNMHWVIAANNPSGLDMQLNVDGVNLNGANKILVNTEIDLTATVTSTKVQICDWVSTTSVDNAADAQCTGGGWRSLNTQDASNNDVNYTSANNVALQWHIYDGYWSTGTTGGTAVSTPLTNFVKNDSSKRVKIRLYSTTATTSRVAIDFLRITPIIDSVYDPAGVTLITGGTMVGTYASTRAVGNTASAQTVGSDDLRLGVPGTAGAISDFYFTFKDIRTFTGMNTIYVKAEYSCSTTGINHRPKIYNFNSSAWENLGSGAITCSATDATNAFAMNNVTVANYINGSNEIRVGWFGSANNTLQVRIDHIFIMLGSTNSDNTLCQVTMGTGTATNCDQTRTVEQTASPNAVDFDNTTEDTSTAMGTGEANSIYAFDSTHSATVLDTQSSNINFSVTQPTESILTGIHFASKFYPGANSTNPDHLVQIGIKDESGSNQATGGWTQVGAISTTGASIITDSVSAAASNVYGLLLNPEDHINSNLNRVNFRLRTTTGGTSSVNAVTSWDFAMTSVSWIEPNYSYVVPITISGSCDAYDQTTDCGDTGTIKVAVNGVVNESDVQATVAGSWSILNFPGMAADAIVSIFIDGAADADEAVAVTKYIGSGDITGIKLFKEHLTIGSNQNNSLTNTDLAIFDNEASADEDIFYESDTVAFTCDGTASTTGLCVDETAQSAQGRLYIDTGDTFAPGGNVNTHDMQIVGTFTGAGDTYTVSGSWNDTGTFTHSTSTVKFTSTTTGELITTTGSFFRDLTFDGVGGGWTLQDSITVTSVLTITNGNFNGGTATTITLSGSGTPFVNNGTFTYGTSTISYTSSSGYNIAAANMSNSSGGTNGYYNLSPQVRINQTYTIGTANSQTLGVANDMTVTQAGGALSGATLTAATYNPTIVIARHLSVTGGSDTAILVSTSGTLTIGGNFTIGSLGNFSHNSGTVILNTSTQADVAGSSTFYNFTVATAGKTVRFTQGTTTTINGLLTVTGTNGSNVDFTSISGAATWTINHQGTENITYLDVAWGACHGSTTVITMGTGSTKDGNSGACWTVPAGGVTISGVVYQANGTTPDATGYTLNISKNGAAGTTTTSNGSGVFTFDNFSTPTNGDIITIWTSAGGGTLVMKYGASCTGTPNCTGLSVVRGNLRLQSFDGTSFTNANLSGCDDNGGAGCASADIGMDSDGTIATFGDPYIVTVVSGTTYAPGGSITAKDLNIQGVVTAPSATISLKRNFNNAGTFTAGSGTVAFIDGSQTSTVYGSSTFNNFTVAVAGKNVDFEAGTTTTINGVLTATGIDGSPVVFDSTTGSSSWTINHQGTESISHLSVSWSACHGSSTNITLTSTTNNGGNNGACWIFIVVNNGGGSSEDGPGTTDSGQGGGGQGGGGSVQATATASVGGGIITGVDMVNNGSGYTLVPLVCFNDSGGGNGAIGTAIISNGTVASITINAGGSGYNTVTVVIGSPGSSGGSCASGGGGGGQGGGGGGGSP